MFFPVTAFLTIMFIPDGCRSTPSERSDDRTPMPALASPEHERIVRSYAHPRFRITAHLQKASEMIGIAQSA
jgi:hypothetical protein